LVIFEKVLGRIIHNIRRYIVYQKNGAGRVIYFDLVMLAEESLKHQEERKEVFNEQNNFGLPDFTIANHSMINFSHSVSKLFFLPL